MSFGFGSSIPNPRSSSTSNHFAPVQVGMLMPDINFALDSCRKIWDCKKRKGLVRSRRRRGSNSSLPRCAVLHGAQRPRILWAIRKRRELGCCETFGGDVYLCGIRVLRSILRASGRIFRLDMASTTPVFRVERYKCTSLLKKLFNT